jgi:hypothetical protein
MMRANEGIYWQDMGLQNAGYTFDYFAPQILEDRDIAYAAGELAPDGPGYRALLIYQEALPLPAAKRILAWAKEGLPVLIVNGVTERIRPAAAKTHGKAASRTPFNREDDGELAAVMEEMKGLPNVVETGDQSKTNDMLKSLGVNPRAAFKEPNKNILTSLREDGEQRYLFVYNYMYTQREAVTCDIAIEGAGKPWRLNCWTGELEELGAYIRDGTHTTVTVTLSPGEAALIAVDTAAADSLHALSAGAGEILRRDGRLMLRAYQSGVYTVRLSDGRELKAEVTAVPGDIILKTWDVEIEDWDEGEKKTIVEDRGLGVVTREVYYETRKTPIPAGPTELKPWREIPGAGPAVSGVGFYKTSFTLPAGWDAGNGAILSIESTNGNSAAVYVNGRKGPGFDFNRRKADITELLVPGENSITVEVSSTLNNRLLARGYHAVIAKMVESMAQAFAPEGTAETADAAASRPFNIPPPEPQDYGMTGEVKLITYSVRELI